MNLRYLNIDYFFKAMDRPFYNSRSFTRFIKKRFGIKGLIGAEIGVNKGENARNILQTLNIKMLYLIDPYLEDNEYGSNANRTFCAIENTKEFFSKRIVITKTSESAINNIKEKLDFVYIDGNHSYPYVKKDIELYWKQLKHGGILGGHDFSPNCPGVAKAVVEFAEKNNLKIHHSNDMDWWFVKT